MRKFALLAAALICLAVTTPARADIEVGTLGCRSSAASTYILVSGQPFCCIFTPSDGRPVQYYQAVVHRFGAQVGFSNDVTWAGPCSRQPRMSVRAVSLADTEGFPQERQ
jgi:hypothetical protein